MLSLKRNGAPFLWNGCAVLAEYAPDLSIQKKILDMLNKFAEDIHFDKMNVSDIDKKSRKILIDYIGDICKEDSTLEKMLRIFNL